MDDHTPERAARSVAAAFADCEVCRSMPDNECLSCRLPFMHPGNLPAAHPSELAAGLPAVPRPGVRDRQMRGRTHD